MPCVTVGPSHCLAASNLLLAADAVDDVDDETDIHKYTHKHTQTHTQKHTQYNTNTFKIHTHTRQKIGDKTH